MKDRESPTKHSNTSLLKETADQGESDELDHEKTLSMPILSTQTQKGRAAASKEGHRGEETIAFMMAPI
jgi:hypothetical protein